ncbi:glycosyltransferase [Pseudoclavibacter chungangensis]|uniref:Glycosyltransferase n=1 Tax=Pseudoclavibacter chungangensis TaxID=587635 RepID=A0A7J5BYP6_9MICO|nr:glycosyltransferase [Pseudoclavibacter chungangensis]KAB1659469.1 glycosyltransferase [Pseudoclavibacter chungangensis]NYJ67674.1 rhamnosyltransferase [Pseudoclavibacter chungangensis]
MPQGRTPSPRIAVLLATHDGERFLAEQLASILDQRGAELTVFVSDDASRDGTLAILERFAADDPRVRILPPGTFGAAAPNFYRLLRDVDLTPFDYVGFADQDDLWAPTKLSRHIELLREHRADGVSSNVTAFHADGTRVLVRKDYPQRLADYAFETPGPGSTYLVTRRLAEMTKRQLTDPNSPADRAEAHDWLVYALARAAGLTWVIDPESTVEYRQHDANAVGANTGVSQALKRVRLMARGWHRGQVLLTVDACIRVASPEELPRLQWLHEMLEPRTPLSSVRLARRAGQYRRRPRDRAVIGAFMLLGLW